MNPRLVVLDTNVFIRHRITKVPSRCLLSAVVLQELAAGASDGAELRSWGAIRDRSEYAGRLLVPDGEDWFQAGRVLNSLLRGLPSVRRGRIPAIDRGEQQRLVRDVLIARSARRVNAPVVTYNAADFEKIRHYCNVRVMEPADFLETPPPN